jgi:hypothetical protein
MLTNRPYQIARHAFLLAIFVISGPAAAAAGNWAAAPSQLSVGEYLDMLFHSKMDRPESDALNSFSIVSFYPSKDPGSAFVLVIQTWRDDRVQPQDLHREIRKAGDALLSQFRAMAKSPSVSKRWPMDYPERNFVVRHVRLSDFQETLGVTINGETSFDENSIAEAKAAVIRRGGVWSW